MLLSARANYFNVWIAVNKHKLCSGQPVSTPPSLAFEKQSVDFALNYGREAWVAKPREPEANEVGEERGGEVDEGWRDGDEEVVWRAAPLLFSMKAEEDKAPLVGQLSCWDLDPIIQKAQISTWSLPKPASPHDPPLLL